ncbi:MAG: regulatory protein RecX [Lachnospiraceae bacterium]|nr:regulatory protein RecX [Lachnospiraceae bacterium]
MIVSVIEALNTKKKKIVMDNGLMFALYNGEVRRYKLEEGTMLSDERYEEILETILKKRARERMMYLLKGGDYTEHQIRQKLRQGFYPEEAIEEALCFGRQYHYLDDCRYARIYAEQKAARLSRRMLSLKLSEKGIAREIIDSTLEKLETGEEDALDALIHKKNIDFSGLTWQERQKICAYFMRKGFAYENILKKINEITGIDYLT